MSVVNIGADTYTYILTKQEFKTYFEAFNSCFSKAGNVYKKFAYKSWRNIKDRANYDYVVVYYYTTEKMIQVVLGEEDTPSFKFSINDNSFGQFLYKEYIEGELNMLTNASYTTATTSDNTVYNDYLTLSATNIQSGSANTTADYSYINTGVYVGTLNDNIESKIKEHENNYHNKKETGNMKFANFDFGSCANTGIRMSMYGLAVKNDAGTWVSYDKNSKSIMDVDVFNFDGGKYLYKIPVAIKDVRVGDVVIHQHCPMFVQAVNDNSLTAVDPVSGVIKDIMLTRSPFGFNYATKIVNLMDGFVNTSAEATAANPFGNMWMLMLMGDGKMDDILPMMMMQGGANFTSNPMLMYFMMKDNKNFDPMMLMAMSGAFNPAPAHKCKCEE